MRTLLLGFTLLLFSSCLFAQNVVKGVLRDTSENRPLQNAVVSLVKKDSTLVAFTRSAKAGEFSLGNVKPGTYKLLITYPKFADYADDITVKEGATDLGSIALTPKAQLLQAVIIKSAGAVRIKGDTTEFVADSFRVREGATVEELLKKLPGFQVNSKGEITAQGAKVDKVLVDGEEFFGDDPTMATRNIGAKAVDKVQIFDTKTDQQQLTGAGAASGQQSKTVNIKLKDDQKKGGFGKFNVATDFKRYHDANLLYNRFVGKKKLSAYATKSNTSTGSLNWSERRRLGIEDDYEFDGISGGMYFEYDDDGFNDWGFRGLPDAYTAGGLFANRWGGDKQGVNASYRYNRLGMQNTGARLEQNVLPNNLTNVAFTNNYTKQRNLNQQHAFNGKWEWKPDSLTTIKFTTALLHKQTDFNTQTDAESLTGDRRYINSSSRVNEGTSLKKDADNNLSFKRQFKKAGRQLNASLRFRYTEDDLNGFLKFENRFYKGGLVDSVGKADQQKINGNTSSTIGAKLTYAEPLSTKWTMVFNYAFNHNNSTARRNTYDRTAAGKYENRNTLFSNNFDMEAAGHSGSVMGRFTTKKVKFGAGSGVSQTSFNLLNIDSNRPYRFRFFNVTPQAYFNYQLQQNTNINFNYNGSTVQPTIDQLQPLRNNTDPLNITIGNPALGVGFRHSINLGYFSYKMLKQTGLWTSLNYNVVNNAITNRTTIDSNGVRTSQAVNVNGNTNWNYWLEWNKGEGEKKLIYTAGINANGGTYNNFINGAANTTRSLDYTAHIGLRYEVENKWGLHLQPKIGQSRSVSSLNKEAKVTYLTYGGEAEGNLTLPGNLELRSEVEFDLRQRLSAFDANPNVWFWKAQLDKKIFKNKSGVISIIAHDILNSYRGINRIITSNFITEERYQRVGQYFQLKLEWSFNKMGGEQ